MWGGAIALLGTIPAVVPAFLFLALAGTGRALMDVAGRTLLQRTVSDEVLSRVFGVLEGLVMACLAVGAILAPVLVAGLGIRGALVVVGGLLPFAALVTWPWIRKAERMAEPRGRELSLLAAHRIFAPLPAHVLERLAGRALPVSAAAGSVVVREGERGDRFYLIAQGELEVTVSGRAEAVLLGPGDGFGEIALMRDVPRTATVTALTGVELLALEREDFLEAVTGHPRAAEAAGASRRGSTPDHAPKRRRYLTIL